MRDKYTDAIRIGKVSSIDPIKGTAQVTFEDREDIVSGDLPILVPFTLEDKAYYMPAVEERVRVLFDPEAPSRGCIIGSYYADTRLPPFGDENKAYVYFKDGTLLEYDKKLHRLAVYIPEGGEKSIDVFTESDISVQTSGKVTIEAAKEIDVLSEQTITIMALQDINITAATNVNVTAATINLN